MNLFMLVAAAATGISSPSIVDAERAYAQMAQRLGQWSAFRATAAPGAILFVPDPVDAKTWLDGKEDPPVSVRWQPARAFIACDGLAAATTGPWQRPTSVGYFATIWSRSHGKWRWNVDFGDALEKPLPSPPKSVPVRRASCKSVTEGKMPRRAQSAKASSGSSPDQSLQWNWRVEGDGSRHLLVNLWDGKRFETVIDKIIPAGKQ
jgi:hypothetical protein